MNTAECPHPKHEKHAHWLTHTHARTHARTMEQRSVGAPSENRKPKAFSNLTIPSPNLSCPNPESPNSACLMTAPRGNGSRETAWLAADLRSQGLLCVLRVPADRSIWRSLWLQDVPLPRTTQLQPPIQEATNAIQCYCSFAESLCE